MRNNLIRKIVSTTLLAMMVSFAVAPVLKAEAAETAEADAKTETEEFTEGLTDDLTEEEFNALFEGLTDEEAIDKLMEITDESLKEGFGENYKITKEEDVVYIDVWYDGMKEVVEAAKKDDLYKESWNFIVETMRETSATFAKQYNKFGANVCLSVLDDTDLDYLLISTYNDKVYYDEYVGEADESALK